VTEKSDRAAAEWKVNLGLELSPESYDRITRAIQKAVLGEIADIDEASAISVDLRGAGRSIPRIPDGIYPVERAPQV
jgi:hypothetical protein